jgi:hypothetical protein
MIINIRGTSGSGKSTLVRRVMDEYSVRIPRTCVDRRQPLYYQLENNFRERKLFVLGHYETACGGCDTISDQDEVFRLALSLSKLGDVLMEGVIVSCDFKRTLALRENLAQEDLAVVFLTTPLRECEEGIVMRRLNTWNEKADKVREWNEAHPTRNPKPLPNRPKPLGPGTASKFKSFQGMVGRLDRAGVLTFKLDREAAYNQITEWLKR